MIFWIQTGFRRIQTGYKTVKSKDFWIQSGCFWIWVHDFLDPSGSRLDTNWMQITKSKDFWMLLDTLGYFGIWVQDSSGCIWILVNLGGYTRIKKEKVHKKNRESPRNFGYKMYPEATPTRSRTYTMDTEKIYLLNKSGRYVSGRLRLWSRWG